MSDFDLDMFGPSLIDMDIKSGNDIFKQVGGVLDIQNKLMRNQLQARELAGPSEQEKFQLQQRNQQTTQMFAMWTSLLKDPNLSGPAREQTVKTMEQVYHFLTPFEKAGLRPWMTASFLDPTQKALENYDKTHKMPEMPRMSSSNDPMERTKLNMHAWAQYEMLSAEWKHNRAVVGYGAEKAAIMSPLPKMIPLQLGDAGPNEQWYAMRDDVTGSLITLDIGNFPVAEVQKAIKEGRATPTDLMMKGGSPIGKEIEGTYNGQKFLTSEFYSFKDGKTTTQTRAVGPGGKAPTLKDIPNYIQEAMMLSASGGEIDKELMKKISPEGRMLFDRMNKIAEEYPVTITENGKMISNPAFNTALAAFQQEVEAMSPGIKLMPFPVPDYFGMKRDPQTGKPLEKPEDAIARGKVAKGAPLDTPGLFNVSNAYYLDGAKWMFQRVDELRTFNLADGGQAQFWWNKPNSVAIDGKGREIPQTKGKGPNELVDVKVGKGKKTVVDLPPEQLGLAALEGPKTSNREAMELSLQMNQFSVLADSMGIDHAKAAMEGFIEAHGGLRSNLTPEELARAAGVTIEKAREFLKFMSSRGPLGGGF